MALVIIESPYAGNIRDNILYARKCMLNCFTRGEYPFASHLLYTQVLNDNIHNERMIGIIAGTKWAEKADMSAIYYDHGITKGMKMGIKKKFIE